MALTQFKIRPEELTEDERTEVSEIERELMRGGFETEKPACRAECKDVPRPCPYVSCMYNTFLDVEGDVLRMNQGRLDVWDVDPKVSCVLDLIDENPQGMSTKEIGEVVGLHHETIRLLLVASLRFLGDVSEISSDSLGYSKIRGV